MNCKMCKALETKCGAAGGAINAASAAHKRSAGCRFSSENLLAYVRGFAAYL